MRFAVLDAIFERNNKVERKNKVEGKNNAQRIALVGDTVSLTYAELATAINTLADAFVAARTQHLGILCDNSPHWISAQLAALHAGLCFTAIPPFFSIEQQRHVLNSAGVDTLICTSPEQAQLLDSDFKYNKINGFYQRAPRMTSVPKGTQLITFTSGTTGQPKGVCLSLALINAVTQSLVETLELETIETHLCLMPLAILLENIAGVFVPLLAGKTVIVKPISTLGLGGSSHLHPGRFSQTLQRLKPDSLILTPALLNAVMQHALSTPQAHIPRYMALGGGVTSNRLLTQAQQLKLPVYQGYGLSECGSVVTVNTPQHNKIGTVGRALPGRAISLAADGEILIDSDHFLGYLSDTESAPSRITSEDGHEQLPTGDLGEIDDAGFLTLKGRKKSQYITAFGRNVSPEWIEAELTSLPHIAQACLAGDGEATLSALIVPTPGSRATDVQRAIDALNSTLPDYARIHHWTPAQAFSVQNDQLTFSGRLKRQTILHDYDNALSRLYAR